MFKSATVKLTLIYLAILLLICAFFSFNWYHVATQELNEALRRQSAMVELLPNVRGSSAVRDIFEERELRLIEGKKNIARQLIAVNILLICIGGLGAFFMAKRTLEPIETAHKAQARFTADASHELRTPLATMQTEIEVALRDPKLTKQEAVELLQSNLEELATLTKLSDGLLRLARQDATGGMVLEPVSLQAIFDDVKARTDKQSRAKQILVTYELAPQLIMAQKDGIVELLVNLVENAIKYSPTGSTVRVAVKDGKQQIGISVIDAGMGISQADLPYIFDRFYRADSSRTHDTGRGHGLGLSLAQHIAHAHKTEIKVSSKPGKGSIFSFLLHRYAEPNTNDKAQA